MAWSRLNRGLERGRTGIQLQTPLNAVYPSSELGEASPNRFQVALRIVHRRTEELSAKRIRLARYFCPLEWLPRFHPGQGPSRSA